MTETPETGQDIELVGNSGHRYTGKLYADNNSMSTLTGKAVVVLTNSTQHERGWIHQANSIYNTDDIENELTHFQNRDDISHLILLPYSQNEGGVTDKVDDLIRSYIHQ